MPPTANKTWSSKWMLVSTLPSRSCLLGIDVHCGPRLPQRHPHWTHDRAASNSLKFVTIHIPSIHDLSKHQWVDITFFHPFDHFGHHVFLVSHAQASGQ